MKTFSTYTLTVRTGLFLLAVGAAWAQTAPSAGPAAPAKAAGANKNTSAKPPVHKADQSALNRQKQDDRARKELDQVVEQLRETERRNEAAAKQLKRLDADKLKDDPAKALEEMQDGLSPEDKAKLKDLQEKARKVLDSPDAKKAMEEGKKKLEDAASSAKAKKSPTTVPPEKFGPSTFDQVPAPSAIAPAAAAATPPAKEPRFTVDGNEVILPPTHDPANPERVLPASDPITRTYVVIGNAIVKTPSMVLEGDRIEAIASPEGEGLGTMAPKKPAKPTPANPADPVQPGINPSVEDEKKAPPFERIIATGRVNIVRIVNGQTQSGKGGSMIYNSKTDEMVLTDWPEAQEGNQMIVGTRKDAQIILVPKGRTRFIHCHLREIPERKTARSPEASAPAAPRALPVE